MERPTTASADADAISLQLHALAHDHGKDAIVVAIDAAAEAAPALPTELEASLLSASALTVPIRHAEIDRSMWPGWLLLDVADPHGSHLLRLSVHHALAETDPLALRRGAGRRIAGWFVVGDSAPSAEDMAIHCGGQMIRRRPDGQQCLTRLHDPAVLWALWPLLDTPQQRQLLGPLDAWWLIDPAGRLSACRAKPEPIAQTSPVPWRADQWQRIDCIAPLNALLRSGDRLQRLPDAQSLGALHAQAVGAMSRARALGFHHDADLLLFATHALDVHPDFDAHPRIVQALHQRTAEDRYGFLVADLTGDDWQAIRHQLLAPQASQAA